MVGKFLLLLCMVACGTVRATGRTDFSGVWVLKGTSLASPGTAGERQSRDQRHRAGHDHGGSGHGMRGMGRDFIGGRRDARGGATQKPARRQAGAVAGDPRLHARTLVIRQSRVVFDIAADGDREVYRFDNRRFGGTRLAGSGRLGWDGADLVLESVGADGVRGVERYALSPDGRDLILHISHPAADGQEPTATRVFVRDGDGAAAGRSRGPALP